MNVSVGILTDDSIRFCLCGNYRCEESGETLTGEHQCNYDHGRLDLNGNRRGEYNFTPLDADASFVLHDVVIGINFHWQRREDQRFKGSLRLIVEGGRVYAVNVLDVEEYLKSVISSEMSATSSLELLKAHAVISRSWLLNAIRSRRSEQQILPAGHLLKSDMGLREIRWYTRDAHRNFDVCADDHCQRYQGITRTTTQAVEEAVEATRGEVLTSEGEVCDARFSKSCGGVSEVFESCWEDTHYDYLSAIRDTDNEADLPDLTDEQAAEAWIRSDAPAYCNTHDKLILSQVLNNYDQETTDFYRWRVSYTQAGLSELVARRSGTDFGTITDLIPVRRGPSGRLIELKIVGTKLTKTIGKELEIRRCLSENHLYSSAFVVDRDADGGFTLVGAGWGHGVGLCQIGAAVMGARGFGYRKILMHYFKGAELTKMW